MKSDRIRVGARPPDFALPAISGDTLTLFDLQRQNLLLIFYRGHW